MLRVSETIFLQNETFMSLEGGGVQDVRCPIMLDYTFTYCNKCVLVNRYRDSILQCV